MGRLCTPECIAPSPAQAHCASGCHTTFRSVSAFDAHRNNGRCLSPTAIGMTANERGIWSVPLSDADKARLAKMRGDE
jgi:hypothetical protein